MGVALPQRVVATPEACCQKAPDAFGSKQDKTDEHQTEEQGPRLGVGGELVLEQEEEGSAKDRPDQRPGAADDHHDEHLTREQPKQQLGIGETSKGRIERAGEAAECIGDGDNCDLVEAGVVTERQGFGLVFANTAQYRAEG